MPLLVHWSRSPQFAVFTETFIFKHSPPQRTERPAICIKTNLSNSSFTFNYGSLPLKNGVIYNVCRIECISFLSYKQIFEKKSASSRGREKNVEPISNLTTPSSFFRLVFAPHLRRSPENVGNITRLHSAARSDYWTAYRSRRS